MGEATVRELRNHGGDILDRVEAGERVTVTRDGRAVARLEPLGRRPLSASALVERFRRLPHVDVAALRADVDRALDQSL
jgi:prevent-host-death family protein